MVNFIFLTGVFCKGLRYHVAGSRYDKVTIRVFNPSLNTLPHSGV